MKFLFLPLTARGRSQAPRKRLAKHVGQASWPVGAFCLGLAGLIYAAAPESEHLRYQVNWPSGLALGEAQLRIANQEGRTESELNIDASVPGFQVLDKFRAIAGLDLCSIEFEKDSHHGKKVAKETTTFQANRGVAVRKTSNGGTSELETGTCGKDALTFLSFVRQELMKGRVPPPQTILFGGQYQIRLQHKGSQVVQMAEGAVEADRLVAAVKGPVSEFTFEMYFARDRLRTPVLVKVPLAMGTFSMELIR